MNVKIDANVSKRNLYRLIKMIPSFTKNDLRVSLYQNFVLAQVHKCKKYHYFIVLDLYPSNLFIINAISRHQNHQQSRTFSILAKMTSNGY